MNNLGSFVSSVANCLHCGRTHHEVKFASFIYGRLYCGTCPQTHRDILFDIRTILNKEDSEQDKNECDDTKSEFTSEQLQAELDKRVRAAEEEGERYKHPPEPLDNPEWGGLLKVCESYIDSIAHVTLGVEARAAHYDIFMAAIQAVFGKEIYGERVEYWIRKKTPPWKKRKML